jgi:hypothetical protein
MAGLTYQSCPKIFKCGLNGYRDHLTRLHSNCTGRCGESSTPEISSYLHKKPLFSLQNKVTPPSLCAFFCPSFMERPIFTSPLLASSSSVSFQTFFGTGAAIFSDVVTQLSDWVLWCCSNVNTCIFYVFFGPLSPFLACNTILPLRNISVRFFFE